MRYFLTRRTPPFERVLLVESGNRQLFNDLIPGLYEVYGDQMRIDLVTCYAGVPKGLKDDARVYRVTDYPGRAGLARLVRELDQNRYQILGIICAGEPIMTKWKWALAARVPAKTFILNENGDYFWMQWSEWRTIRHFILFRLGLSGAGAIRTIFRLLFFPIAVLYLILYAGAVHLMRLRRIARHGH